MRDLSTLGEEDLLDLNTELMEKRAEAETGFKAQQKAIASEIARRRSRAAIGTALEGLTDDDKAALLAEIGA